MELLVKTAPQEAELAYMAGFFDGEGHIRICRHSKRGSYMLQISVVQATLEPLPLFKKVFGGTISSRLSKYKDGKRALYTWQASSAVAATALHWMRPFLRIKHDESLIADKFRQTFRPQYGDRSKLSEAVERARHDMMLSLQWMRKEKRKAAFKSACAAAS